MNQNEVGIFHNFWKYGIHKWVGFPFVKLTLLSGVPGGGGFKMPCKAAPPPSPPETFRAVKVKWRRCLLLAFIAANGCEGKGEGLLYTAVQALESILPPALGTP